LRAGFSGAPEKLGFLESHHPIGRIGQPDEIASMAVFLASHAARFVTGAELPVDGGISARLHDPG
jgi:NAD(P)-dependent dehydrogenase (short-subunit alcohol dehydrogenase family)